VHAGIRNLHIALAIAFSSMYGVAVAKLPALTPEQEQAAAAKKAQAAAQAEKEKQELAASMEKTSSRWRARAAENGWKTYPPTPVQAVPGIGASATQSSPSGQPGGRLGGTAAEAPIRSEKQDTAPPSKDAKDPSEKGK
jgi:hypothetical protein